MKTDSFRSRALSLLRPRRIIRWTPVLPVALLAVACGGGGSADAPPPPESRTSAPTLNGPTDVAVDARGNLYVADAMNHVIRMVAPDGTVTTLAGTPGMSGSANGAASTARFDLPDGVAVDENGLVYVSDSGNCSVRVIRSGVVSTLAGQPAPCVAGQDSKDGSVNASFAYARGIRVDAAGANIYVAEGEAHVVRVIDSEGNTRTLSGIATQAGDTDSAMGNVGEFNFFVPATYSLPWAVALDPGRQSLYVADAGNHNLRAVSIAASSYEQTRHLEGLAPSSDVTGVVSGPQGVALGIAVAVGGIEPLFISDTQNNFIRVYDLGDGGIYDVAGSPTAGFVDGPCANARFNSPQGMIVDAEGNIFVADTNNNAVRKITSPLTPASCSVSTVAR